MTQELSRKIKILSFVAIVGVLYMHSMYVESRQWYYLWVIQTFIGRVANCAVPFFFIISGFLFTKGIKRYTDAYPKIKKRVSTLLVPYLFWCTVFILTVAFIGQFFNLEEDYLALLRKGELVKFVTYCFWTPAAFHLWYVRDLFLIVLLSPLLLMAFIKCPKVSLLLSFLLLGLLKIVPYISWGLWWFSIGLYYGVIKREPFFNLNRKVGVVMLFVGLVLTYLSVIYNFPTTSDKWYSIPIILCLIIGFWRLYDYLPSLSFGLCFFDFTFIIYCAHIPLLNVLKKVVHPMLFDDLFGCALGFILSPIICIIAIIAIATCLKACTPRFYKLITGGR